MPFGPPASEPAAFTIGAGDEAGAPSAKGALVAHAAVNSKPMHKPIFIGMLAGTTAGILARWLMPDQSLVAWMARDVAMPIGQIFLKLIFMVVVPLVVSAIALGVAEMGDLRRMRRVGLRMLGFTLLFTSLAVVVGVSAVNLFQPGVGLSETARQALMHTVKAPETAKMVADGVGHAHAGGLKEGIAGFIQALVGFIPKNPLTEGMRAFEGGLLPLMVFAIFVGLGLITVGEEKAGPFKRLLKSMYEVMLAIIGMAMKMAPVGVAALMFSVAASMGAEVLVMLGKFAAVVIGALLFQQLVVYSAFLKFVAKTSPLGFLKASREAILTAFTTSSSAATLPTAMSTATDKLHLPPSVSNFVLTVGSSLNHHGTALFEGITILFLAQFYGVHLTIAQQVPVILMAIVGGIGVAGVPGGSLPMIAVVLVGLGVPGELIGIVLGVDRLLDMSRTTLNVTGDLTLATIISKLEPGSASATVEAAPEPAAVGA